MTIHTIPLFKRFESDGLSCPCRRHVATCRDMSATWTTKLVRQTYHRAECESESESDRGWSCRGGWEYFLAVGRMCMWRAAERPNTNELSNKN